MTNKETPLLIIFVTHMALAEKNKDGCTETTLMDGAQYRKKSQTSDHLATSQR